jgi:hypothetical protein
LDGKVGDFAVPFLAMAARFSHVRGGRFTRDVVAARIGASNTAVRRRVSRVGASVGIAGR